MANKVQKRASWFRHDADMRNHRKIRPLRNKFGAAGFGVWNMFIEFLTSADDNRWYYSEQELEYLAGDFMESVDLVHDVIEYCLKVDMLAIDTEGYIYSDRLDKELSIMYGEREGARMRQKKKRSKNSVGLGKVDELEEGHSADPKSLSDNPNSGNNANVRRDNPIVRRDNPHLPTYPPTNQQTVGEGDAPAHPRDVVFENAPEPRPQNFTDVVSAFERLGARNAGAEAQAFVDHYDSEGWKRDWRPLSRRWWRNVTEGRFAPAGTVSISNPRGQPSTPVVLGRNSPERSTEPGIAQDVARRIQQEILGQSAQH